MTKENKQILKNFIYPVVLLNRGSSRGEKLLGLLRILGFLVSSKMLNVLRRFDGRCVASGERFRTTVWMTPCEMASKRMITHWVARTTQKNLNTTSRRILASQTSPPFLDNRHHYGIGPKGIDTSLQRTTPENTALSIEFSESERKQFDRQFSHPERILFNLTKSRGSTVPASLLVRAFKNAGLWKSDPRLVETVRKLDHYIALAKEEGQTEAHLDEEKFEDCIRSSHALVKQALTTDFIMPDFSRFTKTVDEIYARCRSNNEGRVASYIPQLARFSPDYWGVSVCSVDGQRHAVGDVGMPVTLQSSGKPINYALAVNELGPDLVHRFIGHEPSGESFNRIKLSPENKPHNPMINPGAIVVSSLIRRDLSPADRFDFIMSQYRRIVGKEFLGFNNSIFLSEKETADRNYAIGYYLQENRCFPEGSNLNATMDLYFQLCSIEINANSGAVIAGTLANGGICPITGEEVLSRESVRNTLALMHSCGMYDYSGEFAFKVGLPAKSSVSGVILVVVPNVVGLCLWSPPLDKMGNSVRGVKFCEQLGERFQFHPYDRFHRGKIPTQLKTDPRIRKSEMEANEVVDLLSWAYNGDLTALRRIARARQNMRAADYDGRTALHIATAEGHFECVRFLVEDCGVPVNVVDRWGGTPLDDAIKFNRELILRYLESQLEDKEQPTVQM